MPIEHPVKRIKEELQRRFRLAGRGSVSHVQEQLGLGKRYFSNQRRKGRQRFDVKVLFDALRVLDVDAAEFFTAVLGPADPVATFRNEAATLLRGRQRSPCILVLEAKRRREAETRSLPIDFTELDALRYDDPKEVKRRVKKLIPEAGAEQVPRLLGCYASACRVAGKLDLAHMVLGRALALAMESGESRDHVDLVFRSSYVAGDRGLFEQASSLAEWATLESARSGHLLDLGKSLFHQGLWLGCLRRYRQALDAYESALELLREKDSPEVIRYRFTCSMNSGIIADQMGDLSKAEEFAVEARASANAVGKVLLGNLATFQASIARKRGRFDLAMDRLREAIEIHAQVSPLDTVYAVIELCRLQLEIKQSPYSSAKLLLPLLERLERNPLTSAYATELLRCAVSGRGLTLDLLNRVARGLRDGTRARPYGRAHDVC